MEDRRGVGEDDVRRRVGHLEVEVGDLKEGQARLEVGQSGMQQDLSLIVDKLNQPAPKTDVWGMVSAIVVVVGVFSSFAWVTLQPIKNDVTSLQDLANTQVTLQLAAADLDGYNRAKQEDIQSFVLGLGDRYKELRNDVVSLKEKQSAAEVSRRAIGDYSKETRSTIECKGK